MPLLEAAGIEKRYPGVQALAGVDLAVDSGEIHALLGENGAGKSTLMKVVAGAVTPDAGQMTVGSSPVPLGSLEAARASGVALVYQDLIFGFTILGRNRTDGTLVRIIICQKAGGSNGKNGHK